VSNIIIENFTCGTGLLIDMSVSMRVMKTKRGER